MTDTWAKYDEFRGQLFAMLDYKPSVEQMAFHADRSRVRLAVGGERAGKSYLLAMDGLSRAPWTRDMKPGVFWIVGPDYLQARPEFTYILDGYRALGRTPVRLSQPQNIASPWVMEFADGSSWETKSSSDIRKLASFAFDGVLMAEAAQQDYDVFLKLRGRMIERRAWLGMGGTLEKAAGWYVDCYNRWRGVNKEGATSFSIPTWSNLSIFPGGREDAEIKLLEATLPPDLFMERFGAVPMPAYGLVFKEFDYTKHVADLEPMDLPVELAIDPGYTGAYAVLAIQQAGGLMRVIDEVYARYGVAQDVIAECKRRPWWDAVPKIADGKTAGVIDVAGKQHQGMASHVEIWAKDGGVALRSRPVSIEDGILVVRNLLKNPADEGRPRIVFDSGLSSLKDFEGHPLGVLGEFGMYRYPDKTALQAVNDRPIDKYNHALKALGYYEYDKHGPVMGRKVNNKRKQRGYWG
tara:strand:- start:1099 stop:2493 length:1395 start_codon:yes stop_codon:yes gene_type:complete